MQSRVLKTDQIKNLSQMLWGYLILKKRIREMGKKLYFLYISPILIFRHGNMTFSGGPIYFTFPVNTKAH